MAEYPLPFRRIVRDVTVAAVMAFGSAGPAAAANVLSRAIENAQPCSELKTKKLGQTIGIDKFQSAEIEKLNIDVNGDAAKIAMTGSLACRTSDKAAFPGDASARLSASASLNLNTCEVRDVSAQIQNTGGTYGFVIDTFKGQIQSAIQKAIVDQAQKSCR